MNRYKEDYVNVYGWCIVDKVSGYLSIIKPAISKLSYLACPQEMHESIYFLTYLPSPTYLAPLRLSAPILSDSACLFSTRCLFTASHACDNLHHLARPGSYLSSINVTWHT